MEQSFPLSIGQGGFTLPSDIDCFWNASIDWPSVFAIKGSSLFLNSTCNDRQQFAHCVQSMRAKYFWLKVLQCHRRHLERTALATTGIPSFRCRALVKAVGFVTDRS